MPYLYFLEANAKLSKQVEDLTKKLETTEAIDNLLAPPTFQNVDDVINWQPEDRKRMVCEN